MVKLKIIFALVIMSIITSLDVHAKGLVVIRTNGRSHLFSDEVTYRIIEQHFDDNNQLIYQKCANPGPEHCPKIGLIQVGYFIGSGGSQISPEDIIKFAESHFENESSGKAFYRGVFVSWRNVKVITYDDGEKEYEYELFISDEINNPSDVTNWN